MGFLDDLDDELDKAKASADEDRERAVAARGAASERVARDLTEARRFLERRGIGPFPFIDRVHKRSGWSGKKLSTEYRFVDRGWLLAGTGFLGLDNRLSSTTIFGPRTLLTRELLAAAKASLPAGASLGEEAHVRDNYGEEKQFFTPLSYDPQSIIPVTFARDSMGGAIRREYESSHTVQIPVPLGLPRDLPDHESRRHVGVLPEGDPVIVRVDYSPHESTFCSVVDFEYQLKSSLRLLTS